jgi:hypothetical protein
MSAKSVAKLPFSPGLELDPARAWEKGEPIQLALQITDAVFPGRRARSARFRLCVGILRYGKESNRVGKPAYEHFLVGA